MRPASGSGHAPVEGRIILGGSGAPCSSVSRAYLKMKSKVLVVTLHNRGTGRATWLKQGVGGVHRMAQRLKHASQVQTKHSVRAPDVRRGHRKSLCAFPATTPRLAGFTPGCWPDASIRTSISSPLPLLRLRDRRLHLHIRHALHTTAIGGHGGPLHTRLCTGHASDVPHSITNVACMFRAIHHSAQCEVMQPSGLCLLAWSGWSGDTQVCSTWERNLMRSPTFTGRLNVTSSTSTAHNRRGEQDGDCLRWLHQPQW